MPPVDGPPTAVVFSNGTSTAVAIADGSFADRARSRLDLIAFIDDHGSVIVGKREIVLELYGDRWLVLISGRLDVMFCYHGVTKVTSCYNI